jgi:hypothetical protein
MNYLYFAENLVETGMSTDPEAILVPADSYLGADPVSATQTKLFFKDAEGVTTIRTIVTLTHANTADGGGFKRVVRALSLALNADYPSNDGFIVFADEEADTDSITGAANKSTEYSKLLNGLGVTTVAITQSA